MIQISSPAALEDPPLLAQEALTANYTSIALLTFALFDYIITLPREISNVWQRRPSTLSALLFFLRYGSLSYGTISVASVFVQSPETCLGLVRTTQSLLVLLMFVFCVGSTLRVYALCKQPLICMATVILGMGQVVSNIYQFSHSVAITTSVPSATCLSFLQSSNHLQTILGMSARTTSAAADTIVLAVTLKKTLHSFAHAKRMHFKLPLITTLIRDGTLYFLIALVMNVAQMILYPILHEFYLTPFITVITPILLGRLFLDLREVVDGHVEDTTVTDINHFSRFTADCLEDSIELHRMSNPTIQEGLVFRGSEETLHSSKPVDVGGQENDERVCEIRV